MEHQATLPAKTRKRRSRRVRSLDLPTVRQEFRKTKTGGLKEVWLVDGRDHENERYRLTSDTKIDAEAKAREQQELSSSSFGWASSYPSPSRWRPWKHSRKDFPSASSLFSTRRTKQFIRLNVTQP